MNDEITDTESWMGRRRMRLTEDMRPADAISVLDEWWSARVGDSFETDIASLANVLRYVLVRLDAMHEQSA